MSGWLTVAIVPEIRATILVGPDNADLQRGPSTGRPGARRVKTSVIYALCSDHAYPEGWTARLSWSVCRLPSLF